MLKTRLTTAAICSAVIIYILSFSPISLFYPLFVTVTTIAIFLSGTEYAALRWNILDGTNNIEQPRPKLKAKHFAVGFSYSFLIITFSLSNVIFASEPQKILIIPITWVFLCFFVAAAFIYRRAHDMHTASNKLLNVIAGFIYLALPAVCLTNLSLIQFEGSYRSAQLYFCLATVFMGDTGAYFIGSKFGKHKLIPKVSPKKSVEGALGGLLFSGLTALILTHLFNLPFPPWFSILVGVSMGIAGQIGDLMESAFKRAGKYKDSGNLLPGHGGILDRIDSLILGVPVAFLFFSLYK
ncbi:phosphatidate cytidylyltransferase [Fluviispira sanaruensis]|uniref:Phosphatidate cytidylyltransferase n=1 Tax=Fluviispira sanaruensis TaxID=2493639 RepID=A0A4P2VHI4_FLUSA|nr:phosphatidate cytidylyltransferase [Fluviispira sanaruensis]BBH52433.1 phosphatidate cytidylyltransferase [Fluviispira sanaruensis]